MFTERALFRPEFAASDLAKMTQYLSMLKTDIRQFVSTLRYGTLMELQEATRSREIELHLQTRERRQASVQSQPVVK